MFDRLISTFRKPYSKWKVEINSKNIGKMVIIRVKGRTKVEIEEIRNGNS